MNGRIISLSLMIGGLALGVAGCVGGGQYRKDMNLLRSQLSTLKTDVDSLKASQVDVLDQVSTASRGASVSPGAASGSEIYKTPSGFTLASRDIQTALKNAGYYNGPLDGRVGPETRTAIKQFQEDHGLVPDGVCGRKTWEKLNAFLQAISPIK